MADLNSGDVVRAIGQHSGTAELTAVRQGGVCHIADATITDEAGSATFLTDLRVWPDEATALRALEGGPFVTALYVPEVEDAGQS